MLEDEAACCPVELTRHPFGIVVAALALETPWLQTGRCHRALADESYRVAVDQRDDAHPLGFACGAVFAPGGLGGLVHGGDVPAARVHVVAGGPPLRPRERGSRARQRASENGNRQGGRGSHGAGEVSAPCGARAASTVTVPPAAICSRPSRNQRTACG